jgi:hypothetical protein
MRLAPLTFLTVMQQVAAPRDTVTADSIVVESPLPGGAAAVVRFLFTTVPQWVQIAGLVVGVIVAAIVVVIAWRRRAPIVGWFAAKSGSWKMGVAAIALVVLGGVGFAGLKSWNFMMHDNGFCTGCHVMAVPFRKFTASEHSQLGCHDCHRQGMMANMRQLYQWVSERPEQIGSHAPVPNAICGECHNQREADSDSAWKRIASTAGHAVHLNPRSPAMREMECVTCHGEEVHRFKPAQETCAQSGCHDQLRIELGRMAGQTSLHCSTCHVFTAPAIAADPTDSARAALVPDEEQCLECHEMREQMRAFKPADDPHAGVCGDCHNPHTQTTTAGAFQSCATAQCHARSDTLTAMHRGIRGHRLETCGACHAAHTWKAGRTNCQDCHSGITDPAVQVRRPPTGAGGGAGTASPAPAPTGDPETTRRTHSPAGFHPVSWSSTRQAAPAVAPHAAGRERWRGADRRSGVGTGTQASGPGHPPLVASPASPGTVQQRDTSRFEHARHRSVTCTTCHTADVQHGALRVRVARRCTACHHAETPAGRACERCHAADELAPARPVTAAVSLAVWTAPRERPLAFAHDRHQRIACADCHGPGLERAVRKQCESCHTDHHQATRTCASCHPQARETHTRALHMSGCGGSGCHAREATPAVTPVRSVCLACHAEQADHKPGRECAPCHLSAWRAASSSSP